MLMNQGKYYFLNMMLRGMLRRFRQIGKIVLTTLISVFFMTVVLLFQQNMNRYQVASHQSRYGDWILMTRDTRAVSNQLLASPMIRGMGESRRIGQVFGNDTYTNSEDYLRTGIFYLGWMSDELIEMGNLTMAAGHMPQQDNEIALDQVVLHTLGYTEDVGQTITVYYYDTSDGKTRNDSTKSSREYILSGVINSYVTLWSGGNNLPSACVTWNEYASYNIDGIRTSIYQLNSWVKTDDYKALYTGLSELAEGGTDYNEKGYEQNVWGTDRMYAVIFLIVMGVGMTAVIYQLMNYELSRRSWFATMQSMGADRKQIWLVTCMEGMAGMVLASALGIAFAVGLGAAICRWIEMRTQIHGFYEVDNHVIAAVIIVVLTTIVIEEILLQGVLLRRKSIEKESDISEKKLERIGHLRLKRTNLRQQLFYRRLIQKPLSEIMVRVFGVGMAGIFLMSSMSISQEYEIYQKKQALPDVVGLLSGSGIYNYLFYTGEQYKTELYVDGTEAETPDTGYDHYTDNSGDIFKNGTTSLMKGYGDSVPRSIQAITGVSSVATMNFETGRNLRWEGEDNFITDYERELKRYADFRKALDDRIREETLAERTSGNDADGTEIEYSGYVTEGLKVAQPRMNQTAYELSATGRYLYATEYADITEQLYERIQPYLGETADYEQFCNGEQVLLFVSEDSTGRLDTSVEEGSSLNYKYDPVILPGFYLYDYYDTIQEILSNLFISSSKFATPEQQKEGLEWTLLKNEIRKKEYSEAAANPKVAGIVYLTPELEKEFSDMFPEFAYYTVLASKKLGKQLSQKQAELIAPMVGGLEQAQKYTGYQNNRIEIYYDMKSVISSTDTIVQNLLMEYGFSITSNSAEKNEARSNLLNALLVNGIMMIAVLLMYLFVNTMVIQSRQDACRAQLQLLSNMGADRRILTGIEIRNQCREGLWVFAAVPLVCGFMEGYSIGLLILSAAILFLVNIVLGSLMSHRLIRQVTKR